MDAQLQTGPGISPGQERGPWLGQGGKRSQPVDVDQYGVGTSGLGNGYPASQQSFMSLSHSLHALQHTTFDVCNVAEGGSQAAAAEPAQASSGMGQQVGHGLMQIGFTAGNEGAVIDAKVLGETGGQRIRKSADISRDSGNIPMRVTRFMVTDKDSVFQDTGRIEDQRDTVLVAQLTYVLQVGHRNRVAAGAVAGEFDTHEGGS